MRWLEKMEVKECIEGRTSVRVFRPDPVEDDIVDEGLRLANLAPSAGNLQARDFVVVRDAAVKRALMHAAFTQEFIRTAPVVVVFCANLERIGHYGQRGKELYCLQDVAAAVQNFSLYLHSKGLGSVWVGAFDEAKAAEALGTPGHVRPLAIVPVGYPAEEGLRRKRLPSSELVHRDRW
ncbi:MAG: nitroreductase family protein [Thermoplasmata archaeon]